MAPAPAEWAWTYFWANVWQILSVIVIPFALIWVKNYKSAGQKALEEIREHREECNKIPKKLIMDKLDDFCERMDEDRKDAKQFRIDCNETLNGITRRIDGLYTRE